MADQRDLAAAYALGALDAQQRAEYEEWLANEASPADRAAAAEFAETAAALALAAEPVQPPAALRRDILSMIGQAPQVAAPTVAAPDAAAPTAAQALPAEAATPAVTVVPGAAERRAEARWMRRPGLVLAAAAAAVALFAGGGVVGGLLAKDDFAVSQASALAELQAAPDSELAKADVAGGGTATLVWSATLGRSAVAINGLSELPAGSTYQLWYIGEDGAVADATFEAAQATTWRVLDGTMAAGDAVAITVEPDGGSTAPTTDPIVVLASA